ncbi:hypothetical protein [Phaeobacter phage MD18]|nr:hypothetical protein [Phaeobacter phage MD18]
MMSTGSPRGYNSVPEAVQQPVCRRRRARFIATVVGFCLVTSAMFTGVVAFGVVDTLFMPIVELFISGMMSLAMATTLAYVGGSVVDYNGGVTNMFRRSPNRGDYILPDTGARG